MIYVRAGYIIVLGTLFVYAMQLLWRRRRLERQVARVERSRSVDPETGGNGRRQH